jgi:inositol phosphorylceramide mannosyltransferase catalytic subunit
MKNQIPARLIQTGKTRNLPLLAQAAVTNLKSLNPHFEYLFFDDAQVSNFIQKEFPQYREIFENFPFRIQKYDFFRYLAVFRLGGFYFDTDVFFARDLSELLAFNCVFPFEELTISSYLRQRYGMDWEIGNYGFGAAAGDPFLAAIIENCVRSQRDTGWVTPTMQGIPRLFRSEFQVLNTTGPGMVSRTLAENPEIAKSVTILFPEDVCDERSWHKFGTFGVHVMQGSWRSKKNPVVRRLAHSWELWKRRKGLAESRKLGRDRHSSPDKAPARTPEILAS